MSIPTATRRRRALRPGDVIISVNRKPVTNAAEAGRELQQIPSGRLAQLLLWRDGSASVRDGQKD